MRLVRLLFCAVLTFTLSSTIPTFPPQVQAETSAVSAIPLPTGFVDEPFVTGLLSPRTFAWTPDGRLLIVERGSASSIDSNLASIRIFQNGTMLTNRAYTREVCGGGERGFLGLAVDSNFAINGFLYIYYSALSTEGIDKPCDFGTYAANKPGPRNTISRLTMVGNTINPASEVVLINNIATDTGIHNGGDLAVDANGYLYASVGDSNILPDNLAQNRTSLNGKILRIKPQANGTYTTGGNPYDANPNGFNCGKARPSSTSALCKEIFAYGFRNPFRFTLKPNSNSLFVADVGGGFWEEVSDISIGDNAGFNTREGPCATGFCTLPQPPSGFVDPIYSYPHNVSDSSDDAAVIGGAFYTGTKGSTPWPTDYLGNYFFSDNVRGFIRRLKFNATTQTWEAVTPEFGAGALGRGIIGLRTGPDGNLYYLTYMSDESRNSEIRRVRYQASGNVPPEAHAGVSAVGGAPSTQFVFSAAGSSDPDNNMPLQYRWDFGDGSPVQTTSSLTVSHQYSTMGTLTVTLSVIDSGSPPLTSPPASVNVYVGNPPPTATIVLTNTTELSRSLFHGGDVWKFTATNASDNTPLPNDAFLWSVVFHHRDHTHPFLANVSGPSGEFVIPSTGEVDPIVWYRVTLFLKDSEGQVNTITRDVYPETTTLTFSTNPVGGQIKLDGIQLTTPVEITRVIGIHGAINVPDPQSLNGRSYAFESWAQGGPQLQEIVVPEGGTSYTATLKDVGEAPTATPTPIATPVPDNTTMRNRLYLPLIQSHS